MCDGGYDDLTFNQSRTSDKGRGRLAGERVLTKDQWQNPEEVKIAIIEAIKFPRHHK